MLSVRIVAHTTRAAIMMSMRTYLCVVAFLALLYLAIPASGDPEMRFGLTFGQLDQSLKSDDGTVLLTCGISEDGTDNLCNPYTGDRPCEEARPLLCFIDINTPAPAYLPDPRYWSGGLVAATDDVRGDKFTSIQEANAHCAEIFGQDWRVASFHDGGGWALRAYGDTGIGNRRVWVDIKDQSEGTCWAR